MTRFGLLVVIGGAVWAAVALFSPSAIAAAMAVGFTAAGIEILLLAKLAAGFTPVLIPVLTINGTFLAAPLAWDAVQERANISLRVATTQEVLVHTSAVGMAFCAAFTLGAALALPAKMSVSLSKADFSAVIKISDGLLVAAGFGALVLSAYAWQGALFQGMYLEAGGPAWAVTAASVGLPFAVLAFAIVVMRPGPWRSIGLVGLVIVIVILFGRASRSLALVPGLLLVARATLPHPGIRARSLVLAGVATVLLLQVALVGRSNPEGVGMVPMGNLLLTQPDFAVSGFSLAAIFGNFLVSAPITALVAEQPISESSFWTSVNPLPSGLTAWSDIKDSLRLNAYTPYNALGELAAQGWVTLAVFAGVAGYLLALCTRISSRLDEKYQILATLLVLAFTAYFSLAILQYNLRSAARLIWYAIGAVSVIWFVSISAESGSRRSKSHAVAPNS